MSENGMKPTSDAWELWEAMGGGAGAGPRAIPWSPSSDRQLEQMIAPLDVPIEMHGALYATHAHAMDDRPMDHIAIVQHALGDTPASVHVHPHWPDQYINVLLDGEVFQVSRHGLADAPMAVYRMIRADYRRETR